MLHSLYSMALAPLSFLLHSRSKSMILDASNLGLLCFAFPLGSKFPRRMHFLYGL